MMQCQICGDLQGPWEYEEYKSDDKKPWLIENGQTVLVCETCAKILRKRMKKDEKLKEEKRKEHNRYYNSYSYRR